MGIFSPLFDSASRKIIFIFQWLVYGNNFFSLRSQFPKLPLIIVSHPLSVEPWLANWLRVLWLEEARRWLRRNEEACGRLFLMEGHGQARAPLQPRKNIQVDFKFPGYNCLFSFFLCTINSYIVLFLWLALYRVQCPVGLLSEFLLWKNKSKYNSFLLKSFVNFFQTNDVSAKERDECQMMLSEHTYCCTYYLSCMKSTPWSNCFISIVKLRKGVYSFLAVLSQLHKWAVGAVFSLPSKYFTPK